MTEWSGRVVERARAIVVTWLPAPCGHCGLDVTANDQWVVGHAVPRSINPALTLAISNWQPEHRTCSDASGNQVKAMLDHTKRYVVLLLGPPGAGKTTHAHHLADQHGLDVYDLDDPRWSSRTTFDRAITQLAHDPKARAVVIRSGATADARDQAHARTNPTHVVHLLEPEDECHRRVADRPDAKRHHAAVRDWFKRYDGGFPATAAGRGGLRPAVLSPSASRLPVAPISIRSDLLWASATKDAPAWLVPYVVVPTEVAHEPTAMSPPHPEAAGSYGPALIEWARTELGVTVRWWQGLALVRILEHRADGSLCWEEVILSCSRRAGKSVVLRLLALWRLVFAPGLFDEPQLVVHSANTLRVAKEPMRYASKWARGHGLKVSTNNNNYSIEDEDGGHRWVVLPVDNTAGLDTNMGVIDEAWAAKPEVVDDDLEPSLLERISPQLLLISTAHRRATSLMRNRISSALAGEDADRTLILLWAAQPTADLSAVETWRTASPHWSPQREQYVARKYAKAARGEQDPEFDDPDPLAGFRSQYTNAWLLKERAVAGDQLVVAEEWLAAEVLIDDDAAPVAAAIDAGLEGVSLALAWREDDRAVVRVSDHEDLVAAVAAWRTSGHRGRVTVAPGLVDDPALRRVSTTAGSGRVAAAAVELGRLFGERVLQHDGGEHLTGQVLELRTAPGVDGPRLVSKGRADAVRAALWAASTARARQPAILGIVTA